MHRFAYLLALIPSVGCTLDKDSREPASNTEPSFIASFLTRYNASLQRALKTANEAEWAAKTNVSVEATEERIRANQALALFLGSRETIESAHQVLMLSRIDVNIFARTMPVPTPMELRQAEKILLAAAEYPGTIPDVVKARVEAESRQAAVQDGFEFRLDGQKVSANDLDNLLQKSTDLAERKRAWLAAKEIGKPLKAGLVELQKRRNQVAREMGHSSFHALQVADYEMSVQEMGALLASFIADTRPLYQHLHTWVKHELARRYQVPVPDGPMPAHWINNRWSQNWTGIVEAANLDAGFKGRTAESIVRQAEAFYVSMGFPGLPQSFWEKSDLYPVPVGETRKKNSHASAWHLDRENDVRSLMSIEPNERWFGTAHHELGHVYYYLSYTRPEVPPILREGANRAFHEGIGELINIASRQTPYLKQVGILQADAEIDTVQFLLDEALSETVPFIAWSAGVMAHWEADLYEKDLPPSEWNQRWWNHVRKYQGIVPPEPRGEDSCDPATKTHVNDDPAQYYDYAIATVLKYQLHDHIARRILQADPRSCSYFGRRDVGEFLAAILRQGATRPWRDVLRQATGEELSTRALVEYFQPLQAWLERENAGRKLGWE